MAMSAHKVAASSASGSVAVATSRVASGGRNVASATVGRIEEMGFAPHIGVNDDSILRNDESFQFDMGSHGGGEQGHQDFTPLMSRNAFAFKVDEMEEANAPSSASGAFLAELVRGVGTYEATMRITAPGAVRPGSVMNYLF